MKFERAKNVILAEDDNDDAFLFEEAIKAIDTTILIRHVKNGDMLLSVLQQQIPDVLFLDIYMP